MSYQKIISNLTGKIRREQFLGKDYIVAPLTMIVPGVLNGSQGALLYPEEEVSKEPASWNGIPIVVNHPETGSARVSSVLNRSSIGQILNASISSSGALVAEGWFDVERTQLVDNRIYKNLVTGKPIELSTGLYLDRTPADEGSRFNNVEYSFTVSNFRPDHLAILFDAQGACSISDGCGVFNELSHDDLRDRLNSLLTGDGKEDFVFIANVFDESVVYERGPDLFKVGYTVDKDGNVGLGTDGPVKVKRMTSFEPVSNTPPDERDSSMSKKTEEERSAIVNELVSNCDCWDKDDEEVLNGFGDEKLDRLMTAYQERTAKTEENTKNEKEPEEKQAVVNTAAPAPSAPLTAEEWYNQAPSEVREIFQNAKNVQTAQKEEIVQKLVGRVADKETKEAVANTLREESLAKLKTLEALVPEPIPRPSPSYAGSAAPGGVQVDNSFDEDDILGLPWDNFDE